MPSKLLYTLLLLFVLLPSTALSDKTIRVNTSIKPPFSTEDGTGFFDLLLKELCNRMDINFKLVRQPSERALVSMNQGLSDMELPRIAGLESKYPNLIMVQEKVINYEFVAFSRKKYCFNSWTDLEDKQIAYLIGWKIFEDNVPKATKVTKLNHPDQLFNMVARNRVEIALYEKYAGWANMKANNHKHIKECKPPLAVKPMYIYLHKSHENLAADIAHHLRQIKKDGTYRKIMEKTLVTN